MLINENYFEEIEISDDDINVTLPGPKDHGLLCIFDSGVVS